MGSIILDNLNRSDLELINSKNKCKFDVITRPKYDRRKLHKEKFSKGGIRKRYGGTTIPNSKAVPGSELRKGDYVEAKMGKKVYRGWVSGYEEHREIIETISVSGFDWNRLGQFGIDKVKLLGRNTGLLLRSMEKTMTKSEAKSVEMNSTRSQSDGMRQVNIDDAW